MYLEPVANETLLRYRDIAITPVASKKRETWLGECQATSKISH
jgi:hypothetical protein